MTALEHAFRVIPTADGPFGLIAARSAEGEAVLASGWTDSVEALLARVAGELRPTATEVAVASTGDLAPGAAAAEAVERYYAGELAAIETVAVRQRATPFRKVAWEVLRGIRPGHPLSYTEFAAASGRPAAVRAAASACATNAPALFVPCHRVLRGDGSLGGFAWGLAVKESLLAREARLAA